MSSITPPKDSIRINTAGKDILIRQLTDFGKKRMYIAITIVVGISLIPLVLSCYSGNFINKSLQIDGLRDFGYHIQFFILLPFFMLFIPYYLRGLTEALNALSSRNLLMIDDKDLLILSAETNRLFERRLVTYFPYAIGATFTIYGFFTFIIGGHNSWNSSSNITSITFGQIVSMIPLFLLYLFLSALILRIIISYFVIRRFLTGNIQIQPLHPDKCGGLSPLGEFSLRITKAGIGIGIPCTILIVTNYYQYGFSVFSLNNVLIILGYILSLSIVFFVPLLGARRCMMSAKERELELISDYLQNEHVRIILNIKNNDSSSVNKNIVNFEGLIKLYELAEAMPVYPFNNKNVIRFLSSIIWPFILLIIQFVIENNIESIIRK